MTVTRPTCAGIGFSLCYVSFISVIAVHFDGRGSRLVGLAFGLATTGVGVGAFVYPALLRWLVAVFSWRGALLMTAGLAAHLLAAAAVLRPPRRPITVAVETTPSLSSSASSGYYTEDAIDEFHTKLSVM